MTALIVRKQKDISRNDVDLVAIDSTDTFWNFKNCERINIIASTFSNCILRFENVIRVNILGNQFEGCQGSHFIQFVPASANKDVHIGNNILKGPRLPAYRDENGQLVDNGATGDCIAIRSVDRFCVCGNILVGGGELGITVLEGAKNGIVGRNKISDCDAGAIWVGNNDDKTVENIVVDGNEISGCAINAAPRRNAINQAGISVRNAMNVVVSNNWIMDNCQDLQFGIFARNTFGMTVSGNVCNAPKKFRVPRGGAVVNLLTDVKPTT